MDWKRMVEKRITELEDFSIESSKTKKAQRTKIGKKTEIRSDTKVI